MPEEKADGDIERVHHEIKQTLRVTGGAITGIPCKNAIIAYQQPGTAGSERRAIELGLLFA